jgi:hypothetical protein
MSNAISRALESFRQVMQRESDGADVISERQPVLQHAVAEYEPEPQFHMLLSTSTRFRYTRTEITLGAGQSRVQHQDMRIETGRMTSQEFDGDVSFAEGQRLMAEAYQRQAEQIRNFWSLFLSPRQR